MHITLTGNLGSGKSTICEILNEKYGFEIYSTGKIQRKMAEDFGKDVLEMNNHMEGDRSLDKLIDDTTARVARENPDKNLVFDSRLAWHFVEKSFKVFLSVSMDEAARRVLNANRGEVETYNSLEESKKKLIARTESEDKRFQEFYSVHYLEFYNYDLVIDTSHCTPEFLAETIIKLAREHEESGDNEERIILFSPKRLGIEKSEKNENTCFMEKGVKIKKNSEDYEVAEGKEILEQAAKNGCSLISCELV